MILEEETKARFGYYSTDLTSQSSKKIIVVCDVCGKLREIRKSQYCALCLSCANTCRPVSKETRKKLSIAGKGRRLSKEHKKKLLKANMGRRLSEKQKRILYEARKGSTHTEESRRKMSDARRGKHPSKETRKKMSDSRRGEKNVMFGKHHSKAARRRIGDAHRGENNANWQGGTSIKYCSKWNEEFREYIRNKFGRKCFLCGKAESENNGRKLSVHHVNGNKHCGCAKTEEDRKTDNATCQFIPLCGSCHSKVHNNREKWEKYFMVKLKCTLNGWHI